MITISDPPKDAKRPTAAIVESLTFGIDRMLAEADDAPVNVELSRGIAEPSAPTVNRQSLLTVHGWPKRYVAPIGLEGREWNETFGKAIPYVEQGGIVIFHGKRGPGKTRMAAEIARSGRFPADVVKGKGPAGAPQDPKRTALYRTAMEFFVEVRSSYRKNSETSEKAIIDRLAGVGLLVLDELQERGESPFEDRLLTHLIDRRYGAMLPTILIANYTREEFTQALGASAIDRFRECGKRFEFTWNSYRRTR